VRGQSRPLEAPPFTLADFDGLDDAQETLRGIWQFDASALQEEHEGRGRAVEDGHFLGGDVDDQVVEAEAGAGRQQVLDRVDLRGPRITTRGNGGGHAGVAHGIRPHGDVHRHGQIDAAEHDAGVGRGRPQRQFDALAAVNPDANRAGDGFERALSEHGDDFKASIVTPTEVGAYCCDGRCKSSSETPAAPG